MKEVWNALKEGFHASGLTFLGGEPPHRNEDTGQFEPHTPKHRRRRCGEIIGYKNQWSNYRCFMHWLELDDPGLFPFEVRENEEDSVTCPACKV